ncbi:MAG: cysteine hydrolase family protein [Kordiimonas sp.]
MTTCKSVLLIVDVQKAIDHPKWVRRNNPDAEDNIVSLIEFWRREPFPIVHIRHDSKEVGSPYMPGQSLHDFKEQVKPIVGEKIIGKSTNNAFIDTGLQEYLSEIEANHLVICGVLTQHSVDCTARMAASLGYRVTVVSDATAATGLTDIVGKKHSAEDVHNITLAHLAADYAEIKTSNELLVQRT